MFYVLFVLFPVMYYLLNEGGCVWVFRYLDSKPQHWRPTHSVVVKDIVNVNQMNIGLYVTHTINFQNYGEKSSRRSELVIELKKIFEELNIKYNLLPLEVHLRSADSAPPIFSTTMR